MQQPANIDEFLNNVKDFERIKQKGSHLLFNEIESDVREKSKFLRQQVNGIENMVLSYRGLLAKINVLSQAAKLFSLAAGGSSIEVLD